MRKALAWGLVLLLLSVPAPTRADVLKSADITTSSTDCSDADSCLVVNTSGLANSTIQVAGTWTGTISFEGTVDGTNWVALTGSELGATTTATSTEDNGAWAFSNALVAIRARASASMSGTAEVTIIATASGGGGAGSAGSVTVSGTATVQGEHAHNSADASDKVGVLPSIATESAPTYTEGRQVVLSTDLSGNLRVTVEDNGMSVDYYPGTGAAGGDANQIKASAGTLYSVTCTSVDTTVVYVKLYESATPTSTSTVKMKLALSGADSTKVGGAHLSFAPDGIAFASAMGSRYTLGFDDSDDTEVTTDEVICHFGYR